MGPSVRSGRHKTPKYPRARSVHEVKPERVVVDRRTQLRCARADGAPGWAAAIEFAFGPGQLDLGPVAQFLARMGDIDDAFFGVVRRLADPGHRVAGDLDSDFADRVQQLLFVRSAKAGVAATAQQLQRAIRAFAF